MNKIDANKQKMTIYIDCARQKKTHKRAYREKERVKAKNKEQTQK